MTEEEKMQWWISTAPNTIGLLITVAQSASEKGMDLPVNLQMKFFDSLDRFCTSVEWLRADWLRMREKENGL